MMSEEQTTSFSTSGEDAMIRSINVQPDLSTKSLSTKEFDSFYDIERTVEEILEGDYKRIALQFPDELLHDSVPIFRRLKHRIGEGRELYVLADTSYGSCCVDEVAASHVDADAVVHYGHACMSQTSRLPVIFVFGKKPVDVDHCVHELAVLLEAESDGSLADTTILFKHDVVYAHQSKIIRERLEARLPGISIDYEDIPFKQQPSSSCTRTVSLSSQHPPSNHILFVGAESLALTNLMMTNSSSKILSYNPHTRSTRIESGGTNRLLMRRYAVVQRARDADVFGILVGTLGVASYLPLITHIRSHLVKKGKKSYTISVGKLNPAKLANFLEIECFVLVACPENSLIESKDFLRPIITPYELEVTLEAEPSWTGRYILNFGQILAEGDAEDPSIESADTNTRPASGSEYEDSDQPVFSLVTGTYRQAKRYRHTRPNLQSTADDKSHSSTVVLRNQDSAISKFGMESAAGQFLQERSYRGLEVRLGADAPSTLEQGRSGIARGYQDDRFHQDVADSQ